MIATLNLAVNSVPQTHDHSFASSLSLLTQCLIQTLTILLHKENRSHQTGAPMIFCRPDFQI